MTAGRSLTFQYTRNFSKDADPWYAGLEQAQLIKRTVYPTVPVSVEYELTKEGKPLENIVKVMSDFGKWLRQRSKKETA